MSEINESPNATEHVEKKEEVLESKAAEETISLAPRRVTDANEIAKLWSRLCIQKEDYIGIGSTGSKVLFEKATEFKRALYALRNPEFSKIIEVEAMVFPALYCKIDVTKEEKWYEELLFKDGEREDLIPLTDKRVGRDDPWKDDRFDFLDANKAATYKIELRGEFRAGVDDQTCIWVKCKDCCGEGGHNGKISAGIGEEGQKKCPHCGGTGKIGARLCPECKGYGHYYSYSRVEKFKSGWVTCKTCGGKGKMKSVLQLNHLLNGEADGIAKFFPVPEGTIPSVLPSDPVSRTFVNHSLLDFSDFLDYRELSKSSTIEELMIPKCEVDANEIKAKLYEFHKAFLPPRARCLKETVSVGICTRYVRFHLTFSAGAGGGDNYNEFHNNAVKGVLPKDFFTRWPDRQHDCDMVLWMDMLNGEMYGKFPKTEGFGDAQNSEVLLGILMKMGMSIPDSEGKTSSSVGQQPKKKDARPVDNARHKCAANKDKKRWKFILLGLLFGGMGAHYIYAKRWGLFSLHVAAFVGLLIAPPLGLLWLATWFGGTFFVKKDGKKRLMV